MGFFLDGKKSHVLCKNNSVRKIVNDRLLKTLVSALTSVTVCIDVPSPSVVSGVANIKLLANFNSSRDIGKLWCNL